MYSFLYKYIFLLDYLEVRFEPVHSRNTGGTGKMTRSRLPAKERRQQIIEKAAEVFAQFGVEGTRTRDIASACGINEALIYRHFAGKDELYRDAMVFAYAKAVNQWFGHATDDKSGLECIGAILSAQFDMLSKNPILSANMWHGISATTHDGELKKVAKDQLDKYHVFIRNLIQRGIDDGSIAKTIEPDLAAWLIRGITWAFILKTVVGLEASAFVKNPENFSKLLSSVLSSASKP